MSFLSAAILLVLVIDPLGNIPLFMAVLKDLEPGRQKRVIVREMLIGLGVPIFFLFVGRPVLGLLELSDEALGMSGGIVLFMIAAKMIFVGSQKVFENASEGEPFIVPLAVPLTAGPAAMTMVMLFTARDPAQWPIWLAALLAAWAVSVAVLLASVPLSRLLGHRGLTAIERLTGMILTTVAVEMFTDGLRSFLTAVGKA